MPVVLAIALRFLAVVDAPASSAAVAVRSSVEAAAVGAGFEVVTQTNALVLLGSDRAAEAAGRDSVLAAARAGGVDVLAKVALDPEGRAIVEIYDVRSGALRGSGVMVLADVEASARRLLEGLKAPTVRIETRDELGEPVATTVFVGGLARGAAPLTLEAEAFPLRIEAVHEKSGRRQTLVLETSRLVEFVFPRFESASGVTRDHASGYSWVLAPVHVEADDTTKACDRFSSGSRAPTVAELTDVREALLRRRGALPWKGLFWTKDRRHHDWLAMDLAAGRVFAPDDDTLLTPLCVTP